jgi:Ca-activated chloride channel family protein
MKKCRVFKRQLTALLHGELDVRRARILEEHLESCAACRAELELHRAALNVLSETLASAPAPERLAVWKASKIRTQGLMERIWFSAQLRAVLASAAVFAVLFMLSSTLVVFTVVSKSEVCFEPPRPAPALRPKMKLKKPRARVQKSSRPKPSTRIVAKSNDAVMPDIALPEMAGAGSGLADGFSMMPEVEQVTLFGAAQSGPADESALRAAGKLVAGITAGKPDTQPYYSGYKAMGKDLRLEESDADAFAEGERLRGDWLYRGDLPLDRKKEAPPLVFNEYIAAGKNAFSTFAIDVDTASYGLARRSLLSGRRPDPSSVRTEEFINSFNYHYRPPAGRQVFAVHTEMAPSPFRAGMDLLKIGIKGRRIGRDDHRGAVLTLVIDTSGSMGTPERLDLVKRSLALLLEQLSPSDRIAIIQFGGEARLVLGHTPVSSSEEILQAIESLQPGGPTQFDKGLELGYRMAESGFSAGDSNRIMIMSDGVANLGELDPEAILKRVAEQRKKGIYLSVLGFGAGTYDDDMLERLANKGDGMYAYIDTLEEARRLLVDELAATLHVIAGDTKIQVEFNPGRVRRYRQLGYENRQLTREQFRDDEVDAGEVGSGQSVTALYDVELIPGREDSGPIATVYVRYRRADSGTIEEISHRITESDRHMRFGDAGARFRLAACAAEFAEYLRGNPYAEGSDPDRIMRALQSAAAALDLDMQVTELMQLISAAERLEE